MQEKMRNMCQVGRKSTIASTCLVLFVASSEGCVVLLTSLPQLEITEDLLLHKGS
jgi:hypothetical protein